MKLEGYVDKFDRTSVSGWACDVASPSRVLKLCVWVNDAVAAIVEASILREDLGARTGKYGDRRHGFEHRFVPPLAGYARHQIRITEAESGEAIPSGTRTIEPDWRQDGLRPVLISAVGRSGTTLLMNRLAQAQDIVVADLYPFEVRLLSYYATALRTLTSPADFARSMHPDRLEGNGFTVGFNPFSHPDYKPVFRDPKIAEELFFGTAPLILASAFGNLVTEYYKRLAGDQRCGTARMFAEKNNNIDDRTRDFTRLAFGEIREIVLVRDPRDTYASRLRYFKGADSEQLFAEMSQACHRLCELRATATADMLFVRYEDMVNEPRACFARIARFLGCGIAAEGDPAREGATFREHATSESLTASIERWRKDLDPTRIARANDYWSEFLKAFGYDAGL
ncbi:MAG TPA: sulfotransferase [Acetobacteraceae bacterium]|nr:sulfotransferase [Acetobacteraceae bacterium]